MIMHTGIVTVVEQATLTNYLFEPILTKVSEKNPIAIP